MSAITSALKQFFRDLPEPLVTMNAYKDVMDLTRNAAPQANKCRQNGGGQGKGGNVSRDIAVQNATRAFCYA